MELEDNFLVCLDLESGNYRSKEEDVYGNEINGSNTSKLLSNIKNI